MNLSGPQKERLEWLGLTLSSVLSELPTHVTVEVSGETVFVYKNGDWCFDKLGGKGAGGGVVVFTGC